MNIHRTEKEEQASTNNHRTTQEEIKLKPKIGPGDQHQEPSEEKNIHQIYDRIFKRIFCLSNLAIINLINALFEANHPADSKVVYLNTEFVKRNLDKRFADVLIQINHHTYHLEAQMTKTKNIVMRVFEYGFHYAMQTSQEEDKLYFPAPIVIYLDVEEKIPEKSTLEIVFGEQEVFEYKVKNFVYQQHQLRELNRKKMIILIPFQLLKFRKVIQKEPTPEHFQQLQNLILNDIIGSIAVNLEVGNITENDAAELQELTRQLYEHIYQHYETLGGCENMKELIEGALELPGDKYRREIDQLKKKIAEDQVEKEKEIQKREAEIQKREAEIQKREAEIQKREAEIQKLKKQLEESRKNNNLK